MLYFAFNVVLQYESCKLEKGKNVNKGAVLMGGKGELKYVKYVHIVEKGF